MINFQFFIYFVTGIVLGVTNRYHEILLTKISKRLSLFSYPLIFFLIIILTRLTLTYSSGQFNVWLRMLWSIPITFLIASILVTETRISRLFSSKYLVYMGVVSYSLYLSHTAIIDGLHLLYHPSNFINSIIFICFAFALVLIVSIALNYFLEKPYFAKRQRVVDNRQISQRIPFSIRVILLVSVLAISFFIAYQSNFNFFSYEQTFGDSIITFPKLAKNVSRISLKDVPALTITFISTQDNLGIVTTNLAYESKNSMYKSASEQQLVFQIKPHDAADWYATSTYSPAEIGLSSSHPFGFPVIKDAKNKKFDMKIYLTDRKSPINVYINIQNGVIKAVSQYNKSEFIKNPVKIVNLIVDRFVNISKNKEAQISLLQITPFLFIAIFLLERKKVFDSH